MCVIVFIKKIKNIWVGKKTYLGFGEEYYDAMVYNVSKSVASEMSYTTKDEILFRGFKFGASMRSIVKSLGKPHYFTTKEIYS